jgi:hypothetical protein
MAADNLQATPSGSNQSNTGDKFVISALFDDNQSAQAALAELRQIGVPSADISVISRDERKSSPTDMADMAGVERETVGEEDLTYSVSRELPNDEDLPTTEAQMTGDDTPVFFDPEIPPDEPLGGSRRLGLNPDSGMVRRSDASTNADVDIYTDFPDNPGGVNPDSPVADEAAATEQMAMEMGEERIGSAVVGAGLGGVAGLLVGLAALAVPGVGPILAAGPIAVALGGMLAGGAAGGIIGALATAGVPEEYARQYAASIQKGSTLISVNTDDIGRDAVERVLIANGGKDVH